MCCAAASRPARARNKFSRMTTTWIGAILARDLRALRRELEAYANERDVWRVEPGISNSAGNLALHLAGNIQYFIGRVLGGSGYERNREAEFGRRDVSKAELLHEVDAAIAAVALLSRVPDARLAQPFPEPVAGVTLATGDFLIHLAVHLTYHLGQVDYHRRIITHEGKTVGALAVGELKP
jgi:uncharacterized damage-inducible protein DinB